MSTLTLVSRGIPLSSQPISGRAEDFARIVVLNIGLRFPARDSAFRPAQS